MEKRDLKHNTIYFHMGPGFHSKIEKEVFSSRYPHVLFLDQPLGLSFSEMVQWAQVQIKTVFDLNEKNPIQLLGHSFGAQIICAALKYNKEYVKEIRILNSPFDSFTCFKNLHDHLFSTSAADDFSQKQSIEDKFNLIFKVASHEKCAESYWLNLEAKQQYDNIAIKYPQLDVATFVKVFSSYLEMSSETKKQEWNGPTQIYYSLDDHLIKRFEMVEPWKNVYPNAQLIQVPGIGHHGLFESDTLADDFFKLKN